MQRINRIQQKNIKDTKRLIKSFKSIGNEKEEIRKVSKEDSDKSIHETSLDNAAVSIAIAKDDRRSCEDAARQTYYSVYSMARYFIISRSEADSLSSESTNRELD